MLLLKQEFRLWFSAACSLTLHVGVLLGVGFTAPHLGNLTKTLQPLEVTLVNSASKTRPAQARAYAQSNLDGGGNTAQDVHAGTPLPVLGEGQRFTPEQAAQRVRQLEQEVQGLLTKVRSNYTVQQQPARQTSQDRTLDGQDLVQRSLEIARLEAEIARNVSLYEKLPKRKFIGASTQEYRYAQYIEDWRAKVERIGNLNYPAELRRQKIFGSVRLTVNIRADGSVESVEVDQTSGSRLLDAAAVRIAKLAAPYAPFPPDIRKETDILGITRTWTFTTRDQLEAE
ncbi:MAG: energy transducer TonB [Sideroxydans sp.]